MCPVLASLNLEGNPISSSMVRDTFVYLSICYKPMKPTQLPYLQSSVIGVSTFYNAKK